MSPDGTHIKTIVQVIFGLVPVLALILIIVFCCDRCPFCLLHKRRRKMSGRLYYPSPVVYNPPDSGFVTPNTVPVRPVAYEPSAYTEGGGVSQPAYPPQPGYPSSQPAYPPQPGYPSSQPAYPPQPGFPSSQPAYPPQPGFPSSQPAYPPEPGYPPVSTGFSNAPGNPPPYPGIDNSSPFNPNC